MRFRGRGVLLGAMAAVALVGALVVGNAVAKSQKVVLGNLVIELDGSVSPSKLSKSTPQPITLNLSGKAGTNDGTHVPPLKELFVEFDKNGHLNTKGLPSCTVGKLQSTLTAQAKASCRSALIGQGRATAEIAFPEQAPFSAGGPILIFNGSKGNKQMLIFHVYAKVPAPTTFVFTAQIGKGKGPYGTSAKVKVPSITSGQGSVTSFKVKINKTFSYKGKKQSVLTATCKTGTLKARGDFIFAGKKLEGKVTRPCTPAK
jgi:hypothetical protein